MTSILSVLLWLVGTYVGASALEWTVHRYLMHRRWLPAAWYQRFPWLLEIFEAHAIRHHTQWYRYFNDEPDIVGRDDNIRFDWPTSGVVILAIAPIWITAFCFSKSGGFFLLSIPVIHHFLHNTFHAEMHMPKSRYLQRRRFFLALTRLHFLHHRHTNRNFNLSFPLCDLLFGTSARPTWSDKREMIKLGLVGSQRPKAPRLHCTKAT